MSEYLHVEKPFLDQLKALGWTVIDQGQGFIPSDPAASLRASFRECLLPHVFRGVGRLISGPEMAKDDGTIQAKWNTTAAVWRLTKTGVAVAGRS